MISPLLLNKALPELLNIGSVSNLGSVVVEGDPQASVSMIHGEPTDNRTCGIFACTTAYDDEEELIKMMNSTPFGLAESVWTNDLSKAMRMISQIEAGTVWVNMHTFLDPAVPFGGIKSSGIGREFGSAFIEHYTELKSVMVRY